MLWIDIYSAVYILVNLYVYQVGVLWDSANIGCPFRLLVVYWMAAHRSSKAHCGRVSIRIIDPCRKPYPNKLLSNTMASVGGNPPFVCGIHSLDVFHRHCMWATE